ncbi:MAG TPA: prepilin-type N-terminal cleavage/methylation domain-containing protein [Methyloprofundus sp.]|uniref:GspH/FimT family pseudopilin n=1 Tax=Methyloprofundus sp. TaxID=2020875 RepID=UPI001796FD9B|nr:GspH/FimT family pseudopilin [Methyloprofundus sp.]HIG64946.1 prepilin-type N-terminal cleavage/methylation domain-containing protein [Methyloprofundus sp.]HIL42563.1 prepilin-type N-terminal cleavage/methylation domain-containing protein [Gammaproteobacteria bacterium]
MKKRGSFGFTLVELIVIVAIIGIIASIAVPSFQDMIEKGRLKEAVESLKSDLMFARTEAIKRSSNINVAIVENGSNWCYGINDDNTGCACGTVNDCGIKAIAGNQFYGTSVGADYAPTFNFRRGTTTAGGATISTSNYTARVKVSNEGRITICSSNLGGYDAC